MKLVTHSIMFMLDFHLFFSSIWDWKKDSNIMRGIRGLINWWCRRLFTPHLNLTVYCQVYIWHCFLSLQIMRLKLSVALLWWMHQFIQDCITSSFIHFVCVEYSGSAQVQSRCWWRDKRFEEIQFWRVQEMF